jgi:hypothetical protein
MDPVDFVGYIIMFIFGAGVLGIYHYNKSKARILPLSVQRYPDLLLEILIRKQQARTQFLVVRITALKEIRIARMYIELIDKKREITRVGFAEEEIPEDKTTLAAVGKPVEVTIPVEEFKNYLLNKDIPFKSFRFVVDALPNSKRKTHELGFSSNWNIYRPDSGKYN